MKAVIVTQFGGPEAMEYQEVGIPPIGSHEVLIRVTGASVNLADIKNRSGNYPGRGVPPYVPGLDAAGIIEAVGSEVSQLKVGQRVIAFPKSGAYAEYAVSQEMLTFPIPDSLDFGKAAACPIVSFTSFNLLHQAARLQAGETVLIHSAAGGVGSTLIQLAKLMGAKNIIGTISSDAKAEFVRKLGAGFVINYNEKDFSEKVLDLTNGKGVEVILNSLCGDVMEKNLKSLAMFGRIIEFGNGSGNGGMVPSGMLGTSCRSIIGYSFGTYRKYRPETVKDTADQVLPLLANGQLQIFIDKQFALNEAGDAHKWLEERKNMGKVILIP